MKRQTVRIVYRSMIIAIALTLILCFGTHVLVSGDELSEPSKSFNQAEPGLTQRHVKQIYPHLDTSLNTLADSIWLGLFMCSLAFIIVNILLVIYNCHKIRRTKGLIRKLKSIVPSTHQVLYVISDPVSKSKSTVDKIIVSFIEVPRIIAENIMQFIGRFIKCHNLPHYTKKSDSNSESDDQYVYDIDDSSGIVGSIRLASEKGKNLWIFVNSPGGDVIESDTVLHALKTYRDINTNKRLHITCIVDEMAQSAGTMIAMSADQLMMSDFAVLGPTDPQTTIKYEDYNYPIGCQLYEKLKSSLASDPVIHDRISESSYLVMEDRLEMYYNNIKMFKSLNQYLIATEQNKEKILETFCYGSIPHHQGIGVPGLRALGLRIGTPGLIHKNVLDVLKQIQKSR